MKTLLLFVAMCCVCLALPSQNLKQRKKRDITGTQDCGGVLTAPQGVITSPNFPNNYPHRANCTWIITTTSKIKITFTNIDIESYKKICFDKLQIFAGNSQQEFCGQMMPPPITASQNSVKIIFSADDSIARKGFRLIYVPADSTDSAALTTITTTPTTTRTTTKTTTTKTPTTTRTTTTTTAKTTRTTPTTTSSTIIYKDCGGVLTAPQGVITSPNFPNKYPDNANCEWNITTTSRIKLTPSNFDLEGYMSLTICGSTVEVSPENCVDRCYQIPLYLPETSCGLFSRLIKVSVGQDSGSHMNQYKA